MIEIIIPPTKEKLLEQIRALEYIILQDVNKKDKEIHTKALDQLKTKYK